VPAFTPEKAAFPEIADGDDCVIGRRRDAIWE
jgi:hypothetical protein